MHGLDLAALSDGTTAEYFAYDGLGSVRQMLSDAGSPLLSQAFDPYGNMYASTGTATSSFGYTGEQTDANGLVYLRARYYAPGMGRFFQMDPSRQEMNPYQYGTGNPIRFVDPSGNICLDPFAPTGIHFRAEGCGYPTQSLAGQITNHIDQTLQDIKLLLTDCGGEDAFWMGYSDQLFTDLSLGLWTDTAEWRYGSQRQYWIGRWVGRRASNLVSGIEFYVGSTTVLVDSAAIPPTLLGGTVCTGASGGACAILTVAAVGAEGVVVVAGTTVAVHGVAVAANNLISPISGSGGASGSSGLPDNPPPGRGAPDQFTQRELAEAGQAPVSDPRQNLTEAGRALQKHGNRLSHSSDWAELTSNGQIPSQGNRDALNREGQRILEYIISNSDTVWDVKGSQLWGRLPNGLGARWNINTGQFIGLLEP